MPRLLQTTQDQISSVVLIGMAASGKSTVGSILASRLGWAHLDTDALIESWWGMKLQNLRDTLGLDDFLKAESEAVQSLTLNRTVISTGGSVIYSEEAMLRLKDLGRLVYLDCSFEIIEQRIAKHPNRGLAIADDQTLFELFNERDPLYHKYTDYTLSCNNLRPDECAAKIAAWMETNG